jgi:uncharacterized membrane protein YdbT with pleckstrin-like domain
MSGGTSENSGSTLWTGKPWILPAVVARSILIIVVAVAVFWIEISFGIAPKISLSNIQLIPWTVLLFFVVWVVSILRLLLLRASNTYILRNDSLEIRTGILTSRSFVVAASGFADMEVTRSISGRIMNFGDITIRTQDESGADKKIAKIRDPMRVGNQIREVMARPTVRIEGQKPSEEKKQ